MNRATHLVVLLSVILSSAQAQQKDQSEVPKQSETKITARISATKTRLQRGESAVLHVEIWNKGQQDIYIFKKFNDSDNPLSNLDVSLYYGKKPDIPKVQMRATDVPGFNLKTGSSLASALSACCIALAPDHFYGGEVLMSAEQFDRLHIPGRYRVQGKYWSRGFLAEDINNPFLFGYFDEFKQLPYHSWIGEVETNSIWIEVLKPKNRK
jgi:hypothetical protein